MKACVFTHECACMSLRVFVCMSTGVIPCRTVSVCLYCHCVRHCVCVCVYACVRVFLCISVVLSYTLIVLVSRCVYATNLSFADSHAHVYEQWTVFARVTRGGVVVQWFARALLEPENARSNPLSSE